MSGDSTLTREQMWIDWFNKIQDLAVEWVSYTDVEGLVFSLAVIVALFGFGLIVGFAFGIEKGRWIEIAKKHDSVREDIESKKKEIQRINKQHKRIRNADWPEGRKEAFWKFRKLLDNKEIDLEEGTEMIIDVFGVDEETAKEMYSVAFDVDRSDESDAGEIVNLDEPIDLERLSKEESVEEESSTPIEEFIEAHNELRESDVTIKEAEEDGRESTALDGIDREGRVPLDHWVRHQYSRLKTAVKSVFGGDDDDS